MGSPQVTPIVETRHAGGFMISEDPQYRSRDQVVIASGAAVKAGTVLGQITTGSSAAAVAGSGNTGTGTMGAITVSAGAKPGVYALTIIEPASNAGAFTLEGPDGIEVATGKVASAFSAGGLAFTLADGGTDFVSGDTFAITVAAGSGKFAAFDPTAANGLQNAAAILWADSNAASADQQAAAITRAAQVNTSELIWGAGVTTTPQKTAALAQLKALGIIAR